MLTATNWRVAAATLAVSAAVISLAPAHPAAHDRTTQVTWTIDVEPILKSRCLGCHATGGFAPLPLDTYDAARAAARAIRDEVLERRMPPWPAARGFGAFVNDRSLSPLEVQLLTVWAEGGTPLGPPAVQSGGSARTAVARAPDLVVTIPAAR